jgi:YD repeat-containing protein
LISVVSEWDYDGNGTTDDRSSSQYAYDKKGNLIREECDDGDDGTINYRYVKYEVDPDDIIASLSPGSADFLLLQ